MIGLPFKTELNLIGWSPLQAVVWLVHSNPVHAVSIKVMCYSSSASKANHVEMFSFQEWNIFHGNMQQPMKTQQCNELASLPNDIISCYNKQNDQQVN